MAKSKSLTFDAFFVDEHGTPHPAGSPTEGLFRNKFTDEVKGELVSLTSSVWVNNPLDKAVDPRLVFPEPIEQVFARREHAIRLFVSKGVRAYFDELQRERLPLEDDAKSFITWRRVVEVSVLFAPGPEMNRLGLRTFFNDLTALKALIVVPGIESHWAEIGGRMPWGIGLSRAQIDKLFDEAFHMRVEWAVAAIAGFSTGYLGVNGTLRNALLPISGARRLVFFDCLYVEGGKTAAAIGEFRRQTRNTGKVVAYVAGSKTANSLKDNGQLAVDIPPQGVIDIRGYPPYMALIVARLLDVGRREGHFDPPEPLKTAHDRLMAVIPKRGTVVSSKKVFQYANDVNALPAGTTVLQDWAQAHDAEIQAFFKLPAPVPINKARELIWDAGLLGYGNRSKAGEEVHDGVPAEFCWEFLT